MSKKPFSRLYCKQFLYQNSDAKGVLKSQELKTWKTLSQNNIENIEMLYILTFQVLSRFSVNFLFFQFFLTFGQNPGYFQTWTDNIQISRFSRVSRFHWEPCIIEVVLIHTNQSMYSVNVSSCDNKHLHPTFHEIMKYCAFLYNYCVDKR